MAATDISFVSENESDSELSTGEESVTSDESDGCESESESEYFPSSEDEIEEIVNPARKRRATQSKRKLKVKVTEPQKVQSKLKSKKTKQLSITQEELEDFCFDLGEKKLELSEFCTQKLKTAGDIDFFETRTALRDFVLLKPEKFSEVLDVVCEEFISAVRETFLKIKKQSERKAYLAHKWTQLLPSLLQNKVWYNLLECYRGDKLKEDAISIMACICEGVYDFAHDNLQHCTKSIPENVDAPEDKIILHRFAGSALYRMIKVRKNTVEGKKGTVKATKIHKESMVKELSLLNAIKRESLDGLPRELSVYLNEGGLYFVKDEMLEFVYSADNVTRRWAVDKVFRRSPSSFLTTVFNNVYTDENLSSTFYKCLAKVGVKDYGAETVKAVYTELLKKLCRTRVKVFMTAMKEEDLKRQSKVCDVDSALRDKLKGFSKPVKDEVLSPGDKETHFLEY